MHFCNSMKTSTAMSHLHDKGDPFLLLGGMNFKRKFSLANKK